MVGGALEVAKGDSALEGSEDVSVERLEAKEVVMQGRKGGAFE